MPQKTFTKNFEYPAQKNCEFGKQGNLQAKNAHLQARKTQSRKFQLPSDSIICSFEVSSNQSNIRYDDFLIFTLNDYLLMLSNRDLLKDLPVSNGVYSWDFDKIKGAHHGFDGGRYCLGNGSTCVLPDHDKSGSVNFTLGSEAFSPLADHLKTSNKFSLDVIATGDDNSQDCMHTDIVLGLKIKYVIKKN